MRLATSDSRAFLAAFFFFRGCCAALLIAAALPSSALLFRTLFFGELLAIASLSLQALLSVLLFFRFGELVIASLSLQTLLSVLLVEQLFAGRLPALLISIEVVCGLARPPCGNGLCTT